jgi:hypothetical protein
VARATAGYVRHRVSLPRPLHERLRGRASAEVTPVAELIRRVIDLIATFDFNSPSTHILEQSDQPCYWFNLTLSPVQIEELIIAADNRGYPEDVFLAGALAHYLDKRDEVCPFETQDAA